MGEEAGSQAGDVDSSINHSALMLVPLAAQVNIHRVVEQRQANYSRGCLVSRSRRRMTASQLSKPNTAGRQRK
jgi:hypothetical protein